MGRGRAKAKQTKVARELKYRPVGTDLTALQAELAGNGSRTATTRAVGPETEDDEDDPYAAYVADDEDEDEDDRSAGGARSAG